MKITDYIKNTNKTLFSYEIIPPFRGGSIDKVFKLVEELMPYDPPFIDLTSRSAESYYQDDGRGNLIEHIINKLIVYEPFLITVEAGKKPLSPKSV